MFFHDPLITASNRLWGRTGRGGVKALMAAHGDLTTARLKLVAEPCESAAANHIPRPLCFAIPGSAGQQPPLTAIPFNY